VSSLMVIPLFVNNGCPPKGVQGAVQPRGNSQATIRVIFTQNGWFLPVSFYVARR
jgi:hypothetical protein